MKIGRHNLTPPNGRRIVPRYQAAGTVKRNANLIYFKLVATIADVDQATPENPRHPSPVLLLEIVNKIERVVLPAAAWKGPREVLQVGRRVRVAGTLSDVSPKAGSLPVAFHIEFVDAH